MNSFSTYRHRHPHRRIGRYHQVVRILARHGFGWLLSQLGLDRLVRFRRGILGRGAQTLYTPAEHLRLALEELGTTFVKLGQILSTRSDLLPPEYIAELSRLQDAVPPEPFHVVEAQVSAELGKSPSELFAEFETTPIGSASIGQVHAARLATGEEVVVKVRRPGVEELVEEDLAILRDLARLAAGRTVWGQIYDLPGLVDEFATTIGEELDYLREGRNADRFRHNFAGMPQLRVPVIHWQYTSRGVLTMERLRGIKIDDLESLQKAGHDRKGLARAGTRVVLKMVLEDGFFHADPHPGNFLVMEDGAIGLLDYGMVGQIDESTKEGLLYLLLAIANHDMERVVDQLAALGVAGTAVQMDRLRRDLSRLLSLYWGLPLKEIDVTRVLEESLATAQRHHLQVPTNLVLLAKAMAMNEGLARTLDPEFSTAEVLQPYVARLAWESYLPQRWGKRLLPALMDLSRLAVTLPRRGERLLTQAERGNLSFSMRIQDIEHVLDVLNGMANRLILGMLTSAFVVGIALLLQVYFMAGLNWPIGWLLGVGLVVAVGLGLWLVFTILRGGRH